jgi:hypothetical protein
MRPRASAFPRLLLLILPAVAGVSFHRLLEAPGSLIVDGRRASLDHAERGQVRGLGNDLTSVFLPRFCYVVEQVRGNGRWPLWDATGFGGRPLVGNPQGGIFYPPYWAAVWSGQPSALGWFTIAHLIWAGIGVYVLTRSLGLERLSAVVAGGCYEASPYLIAHTFEGHYPHVWSACWYPWAFWALTLASRRQTVGLWLLPLVLTLTFLTGHPQEWYYLVLALTLWVTVDACRSIREGEGREGLRRGLLWVGLLGVSLGLCAVEVLPELASGPWLLKSSVIPLAQVNRYHLHGLNVFQILSPFALGRPEEYAGHDNYWETVFSIGLAPLVLAVIGFARHEDRAMARRWGLLILVSVVFAAGRKLGLFSIAYAVLPGMERFRVPSRSLFLASLGASVLAGAGVDVLLRGGLPDRDWRRLLSKLRIALVAVACFVLVLPFVSATLEASDRSTRDEARSDRRLDGSATTLRGVRAASATAGNAVFWFSLLGMAGVALFAGSRERGREAAAWGMGLIGLIELSLYAQSLLVCSPASGFQGREEVVASLLHAATEPSGPGRIASVGNALPDLRAAGSGLEKTNVNDGYQIQHAADLYERLYPSLDPDSPQGTVDGPMDRVAEEHQARVAQTVLDLMSVRHVVSRRELPIPGLRRTTSEKVGAEAETIWTNPSAMPRAYVVPRGIVSDGTARTVMARLRAIDPRQGVLMNRDPLPDSETVRQPFTPAEWVSRDPDLVTVQVETSAPGLLVVGNTWMPGWTATVDALAAPVLRGNHWQQVVPITRAGRHEIVLRYEPLGLALGWAITAGALFGWGGVGLIFLAQVVRQPGWGQFSLKAAPATVTA